MVGGALNDEAQLFQNAQNGRGVTLQIGRYDPAIQRWRIYPEFVPRSEQPVLLRLLRKRGNPGLQQATAAEMDAGANTVDAFHPYTHKIRAELADITKGLGRFLGRPAVREALSEPGGRFISADDATFFHPAMASEVWVGRTVIDEVADGEISVRTAAMYSFNRLTIAVRGFRQQNPRATPGHVIREQRSVMLARRSDDDPTIWVPNMDIIEPEQDWPTVLRIAETLERAHLTNPDFSLLHCAVAYGAEYGKAAAHVVDPV
jgi:hypothetical protein